MTIPDFPNKIKAVSLPIQKRLGERRQIIIYMAVLAVACLLSFYLGYVARAESAKATSVVINCPLEAYMEPKTATSIPINPEKRAISIDTSGQFIASKNGTKYYRADCGGANRIKEENKVYFNSANAAEAAGYSLSATCK